MKLVNNMQYVKVALVVVAILIAGISLVVSNVLTRDLTRQEYQSVEVWAEAMRSLQNADESTDMALVLKVINGNNNIPVVVVDKKNNIIAARNVGLPQDSVDLAIASQQQNSKILQRLRNMAGEMKAAGQSISISLEENEPSADGNKTSASVSSIDVCYSTSIMIQRLATYPYVQLGIVALFIAVAIWALLTSKRAEQNKVWVGLSRETAHQLGTPISSLMAGSQILKDSYPDDPLLPEMDKDIQRLQLIAERFSKIGSTPELTPSNLTEVIRRVVLYMERRSSEKVSITTEFEQPDIPARLNVPLFEWVLENLCKNAMDAMAGSGKIHLKAALLPDGATIRVSDTGKGIARKNFKNVFKPGFTTKRRGWGLGLSLAKRIVEEYHGGHIFVENSEMGHGTTFCIILHNA